MGHFSHPLWGCFDDWKVCIFTFFLPCVTTGKVAGATGRSWPIHCLVFIFLPPISLFLRCCVRRDIRKSKGIGGHVVADCLIHCLVAPCALCQEAQETGALNSLINQIERT